MEDHAARVRELAPEYSEYLVSESTGTPIKGILFHNGQNASEPSWLNLAAELTGENLRTGRIGTMHRALFLVTVQGKVFLLTFGHAHAIARKCRVERGFGKAVVANAKGENELRGYTSQVYSGRGKSRTERRAHSGPNRELEIPRRLSNLQSIAAKIDDDEPVIVDGGIGVRYHAPTNVASLVSRAARLITWWNNGIIGDAWLASFDRVEQEKDEDILAELESRLDALILSEGPVELSLSLDNELLWEADKLYCQVNRGLAAEIATLDVEAFREALKFANKRGADIRKVALNARLPDQSRPFIDRTRDVFSYELQGVRPGMTHLFEDGTWFKVSTSWHDSLRKQTKQFFEECKTVLGTFKMPDYSISAKGEGEDGYIDASLASTGYKSISKHHKDWLEELKLEICDLCFDGRFFVQVKRGTGFSSMSEACNQVMQAATELSENPVFRTWAQERVFTRQRIDGDITNRKSFVFVVALVTKNPNRLPNSLTVRAMDSLLAFKEHLDKLNYIPAVIGIRDVS